MVVPEWGTRSEISQALAGRVGVDPCSAGRTVDQCQEFRSGGVGVGSAGCPPKLVPVFSTDSIKALIYAQTAHFGSWKQEKGEKDEFRTRLMGVGLSGQINTSYIERVNLTLRGCISKPARRTWG